MLRQRKDELEMRMSALQETRRELMVQLEGLMKLLKVSRDIQTEIQISIIMIMVILPSPTPRLLPSPTPRLLPSY